MSGFVVIGLEDVFLSGLGSFVDAFELVRIQLRNMFSAGARMQMTTPVRVLTPDARPVQIVGGRRLIADAGLDPDERYDLIYLPAFVTGGEGPLLSRLKGAAQLCAWLHEQHRHGAIVAASGSAVFVLAQAGLLAGSTAAVSRPLMPMFRRAFPGIRINHRHSTVEHERVLTSIGLAADTQLLARLVERVTTPALARWLNTVTGLERTTYEQLAQDDLVASAQAWLENRFAQQPLIRELARELAVSQQTLLRRFQRHFGMSPRDYVRRLRIDTACELLARTRHTVQEIGALVGYNDAHAFSKAFRQLTGTSAKRYRANNGARKPPPGRRSRD